MSVDYYQRIVNGLDKEIADLAKKIADIGNQQKSPILQVQGWGFSCTFIGNGAIIKVEQNMICLTKYCWIAKLTCGY